MATEKTSAMSSLSTLEATLQVYFVDKAPFQIPKGGKEAIVQFAPWVIIILMVLAIPALLALIGLSAMMSPAMMAAGQSYSMMWWVSTALLIVSLVIEAIALPGLFARTMQGWRMIFYSQLVSIVASVVNLNIFGAIVSAIIGFYILFQIKEMYR